MLPTIVVGVPQSLEGGLLASVLPGLWLAGLVASLLRLAVLQRNYVLRLDLTAHAIAQVGRVPVFTARATGATPAVVGALRPRIVLPGDFEQRYDAVERDLVLAHEAMHVRRRDGLGVALMEIFRSVFWFNPLLPLAAACLRLDQELACDAAVLRGQPGRRRRYAEAMMKTQLADTGLPVGCHWQSSQSLKERILMLKQHDHTATRVRAGTAALLVLTGVLAATAYAAQPLRPLAKTAAAPDTPPTAQSMPSPVYPREAIAAKMQGVVTLRVHVASDGTVQEIEVDPTRPSTPAPLQTAALDAVKAWHFTPALHDGVAVDSWVAVPITFLIDPDATLDPPASNPKVDTAGHRPAREKS